MANYWKNVKNVKNVKYNLYDLIINLKSVELQAESLKAHISVCFAF